MKQVECDKCKEWFYQFLPHVCRPLWKASDANGQICEVRADNAQEAAKTYIEQCCLAPRSSVDSDRSIVVVVRGEDGTEKLFRVEHSCEITYSATEIEV